RTVEHKFVKNHVVKFVGERRTEAVERPRTGGKTPLDSNSRTLFRKEVGYALHVISFARQISKKIEVVNKRLDKDRQVVSRDRELDGTMACCEVLNNQCLALGFHLLRRIVRTSEKTAARVPGPIHRFT